MRTTIKTANINIEAINEDIAWHREMLDKRLWMYLRICECL